MPSIEPHLTLVSISDLRPTQITMGKREVQRKRQGWKAKSEDKASGYLGEHLVPVVIGPEDAYYLIDHHHLALALHLEGQDKVLVQTVAHLDHLGENEFFRYMDKRCWLHPFDEKGHRQDPDKLPKTVEGLIDDPFRSLAGELREAGGFAKDTTPFSEFMWADFLRHRIPDHVCAEDPQAALKLAFTIAKSRAASFLPGWCGP